MKIISWNVNGIRAAVKKGFLEWFQKTKPDILCLQEVRAVQDQIPVNLVKPHGYYTYFNAAHKKGYSGVAVYTKEKPIKVEYKLGMKRFDQEGRMISLKYQNFTLINLYLPNGGRDKENLDYKLKAYQCLLNYLKENKNKSIILTGDFNIAHQEIDLARPKQNYNNTMFTPKEREQIDKIINMNLADTFRVFNKKGENYTWWSNFANARNRNLGWRIDYVFISQKLTLNLKKAFILPKVKGSDHCPIGIEI
jgi:exodeoxyribonuclease-3